MNVAGERKNRGQGLRGQSCEAVRRLVEVSTLRAVANERSALVAEDLVGGSTPEHRAERLVLGHDGAHGERPFGERGVAVAGAVLEGDGCVEVADLKVQESPESDVAEDITDADGRARGLVSVGERQGAVAVTEDDRVPAGRQIAGRLELGRSDGARDPVVAFVVAAAELEAELGREAAHGEAVVCGGDAAPEEGGDVELESPAGVDPHASPWRREQVAEASAVARGFSAVGAGRRELRGGVERIGGRRLVVPARSRRRQSAERDRKRRYPSMSRFR